MKEGLAICIICLLLVLFFIYSIKYILIEDNFLVMKNFGKIKN